MKTYSFTFQVAGDDLTEQHANDLFDAGCDDCSPGVSNGRPYVAFDREAESLEKAIATARAGVESVGLKIIGLEMDSEELEAVERVSV